MFNDDLKANEIKSRVEKFNSIDFQTSIQVEQFIKEQLDKGLFIVLTTSHVWIGEWNNGSARFPKEAKNPLDPKFLLNFKVFNDKKELFIWRNARRQFQGRIRIDDEGDNWNVVEVKHVVWGTNYEPEGDNWTRIFEERGTDIIIPYQISSLNPRMRVKLLTRYYIDYNELCIARYGDSRFIKLEVF